MIIQASLLEFDATKLARKEEAHLTQKCQKSLGVIFECGSV